MKHPGYLKFGHILAINLRRHRIAHAALIVSIIRPFDTPSRLSRAMPREHKRRQNEKSEL
jgi:hypothetical protein